MMQKERFNKKNYQQFCIYHDWRYKDLIAGRAKGHTRYASRIESSAGTLICHFQMAWVSGNEQLNANLGHANKTPLVTILLIHCTYNEDHFLILTFMENFHICMLTEFYCVFQAYNSQ